MEKIYVLMSGIKGKMATEVAMEILLTDDIELGTAALDLEYGFHKVPYEGTDRFVPDIKVIEKERHEAYLEVCKDAGVIVVDFTQPDAVNRNAEMYCNVGNPFVMGTTGGDRKKLEETVRNSDIPAVVAPNMAKEIVATQGIMEGTATRYEGILNACTLEIIESHQQGKKDTSGTAKAMVKYFNQFGIEFDVSQIEMIRDPEQQLKMGVPKQYLGGHGWHTYVVSSPKTKKDTINSSKVIFEVMERLEEPPFESAFARLKNIHETITHKGSRYKAETFKSDDGTMLLRFGICLDEAGFMITHNINGRRPYALGTLDAIRFVADKAHKGEKGCYSMVDVIKEK